MSAETSPERIAVLETRVSKAETDLSALHSLLRESIKENDREREELRRLVQAIRDTQAQQKSFLGGAVFVISALWMVGTSGWTAVKKFLIE